MNKKNKKDFSLLIPTIYLLVLFVITAIVYFTRRSNNYFESIGLDNITYVSNNILNRSIPVVSIPDILKAPVSEKINIVRYFYDSRDDLNKKENSLVFYQGTYMPNTGIDYANTDSFDVLTIYDGTVIDVSEDELLGKTVKVKHNNELISVYQGVDNIEVKVGDIVFTGQKIATSGKSKINMDLGESMHFEVYKSGIYINPLGVLNQKIGDI